jgi:hypothetical protein
MVDAMVAGAAEALAWVVTAVTRQFSEVSPKLPIRLTCLLGI